MKKRVKKIIRKLREKALDVEGYNKVSKDLYSLHKLVLSDKRAKSQKSTAPTNVRIITDDSGLDQMRAQLKRLKEKTKGLKSLKYYEDQLHFYESEKRLKTSHSEFEFDDTTEVFRPNYKIIKKNVSKIQEHLMDF